MFARSPGRGAVALLGARGEVLGRLGYSLAAYRMEIADDLLTYVLPSGVRETQNAGETLHRGVEVGVGAAINSELRADLGWSWAEHTYERWSPAEGVDYSGNEQESAPNTLWSARLAYSPALLRSGPVSLEASRVGSYWLDAENSHRYDGHTLLSLSANVPVAPGLELVGKVVNLADERFAESASYTRARGEELAPGTARTLYLGAQYRLGGGR